MNRLSLIFSVLLLGVSLSSFAMSPAISSDRGVVVSSIAGADVVYGWGPKFGRP